MCHSRSANTGLCTANNDEGSTPNVSSNDPPMMNNDTLSTDDALLLTVSFPYHSFVAKYIHEYATKKGFLPLHKCKNHFRAEASATLFPGDESSHLLESSPSQDKKYPRSSFFCCSCKSQGRIKGIQCCFHLNYFWDSCKRSFVFSCQSSNLSHNHRLFPQPTVVNGCIIVNLEK